MFVFAGLLVQLCGTLKRLDEGMLARLLQLEADNHRLENELTRQKEETDEVRRVFSDKSDQVSVVTTSSAFVFVS